MSTYQELKGLKIKYLSSDTSGDRVKEGEVFYNSKDFNLKSFVATAAWNSSGSLGTARSRLATIGTQTEALTFGGATSPTSTNTAASEEYNGSGFSVGGDLNTARRLLGGAGTQTAGLAFAGLSPASPNLSAATEEYGGTSWTNGNNIGTARYGLAGAGTQTAGLGFGGYQPPASPPNGNSVATEEYDGTNWSAGGNLNTGLYLISGTGTQTAALGFGGNLSTATEEYNGSSWTTSGTLNTGRSGAGAAGTQTAAAGFGGELITPAITAQTELYDGTSWAISANMATGRLLTSGCGTQPAGLCVGGGVPAASNATEEFTISLSATTAGAWASGNAASTARNNPGSAGTKTAGMIISGSVNDTELYNGTSFSEGPDVNVHAEQHFSTGTQTAALKAGGSGGNQTEEYNGSSFSNVPGALTNYPRNAGGSAGTQTAAVMFGGNNPPGPVNAVSHTEEYNGTSFSEVNNMSQARFGMNSGMGGGTQTAAIAVGGFVSNPPLVISDKSEEYDGTNWSSGGDLLTPTQKPGMGGTQTALMVAGSELPSVTSFCQTYDGSSFATAPSMGNVQAGGASAGSSTSMWHAVGGDGTANLSINQEFTGESTAARAVKTVDFD
jgi:hypothetical protein